MPVPVWKALIASVNTIFEVLGQQVLWMSDQKGIYKMYMDNIFQQLCLGDCLKAQLYFLLTRHKSKGYNIHVIGKSLVSSVHRTCLLKVLVICLRAGFVRSK